MQERSERRIDTFKAIDEKGTEYTINCIQEFIKIIGLDKSESVMGSLKRYETSRSNPVNRIDENTFEIVHTKTIVKKVLD